MRNIHARLLLAPAAALIALSVLGCEAPPRRPAMTSAPTTTQWSYRGQVGTEIRTEHWVVYTTTTQPHWMDDLPEFAEAAYAHYQALVPAPATSRSLTLYVFSNGVQWDEYADRLGVLQSDVDIAAQINGFAHKDASAVYLLQEPADTLSAIGHTGMHQYLWLHDAADAPLWIREGLATQAEGFDQSEGSIVFKPRFAARRFHHMRTAMARKWLLDLNQLLTLQDFGKLPNPHVAAQTYLSQLWAMMIFMEDSRDYQKGYQQLRRDLADGTLRLKVQGYIAAGHDSLSPGEAAFRFYITEDTDTFWRRYMDWAVQFLGLVR